MRHVLLDISVDPGLSVTGFCLWSEGKLVGHGCIQPPAKLDNDIEKLFHIHQGFVRVMTNPEDYLYDPPTPPPRYLINRVVIEKFQQFINPVATLSMMKCCYCRGILMAAAFEHAAEVSEISKGRRNKEAVKKQAQLAGLKCNEHIAHAYVFGCLSGLGNGPQR